MLTFQRRSLVLVLLAFVTTLPIPASAQPKFGAPPGLPQEVKATLPRGATSLLWQRLPIGPKGTQLLVHLWAVLRPNTPDTLNRYNRYRDSPFCLDVFAPCVDSKKRWGWHLVSSASYLDTNAPTGFHARWLMPTKQQGPVLEILSGNGAPGVSTKHTLLVWRRGFEEGTEAPTPQTFWSGGSGGGLISLRFEGVDERGIMLVTSLDSYAGKVNTITTYRWDGDRFTPTRQGK